MPAAGGEPLLVVPPPPGADAATLALQRRIDELYIRYPFYGNRQMSRHLRREGLVAGRHRVRRLMRQMGPVAIYRKPRTSEAPPGHRVYPYLLGELDIRHPYQVECADITYIPTSRGFLYPVAVMDWHSRCVLSWRLSNTQDSAFCVEALEEALEAGRRPQIFNTDQGSQFTSEAFTGRLEAAGVRVSMDGRRRFMDNILIERLWRSLKYEAVYRHGLAARRVVGDWVEFYNNERPHSLLEGRTPREALQAPCGEPAGCAEVS